MVTVNWPSAEAPGFPRFSVDLPEGWSTQPEAGAALFATDRSADVGFAPNVVVNVRRVSALVTASEFAASLRSELQSLDDFEIATDEAGRLGGLDAWVMEYAFSDVESRQSVFQIYLVLLCPLDDQVSDALTVVISHGGEQLDSAIDRLRGIATSVRVAER